jgi:hypothetical protein
MDTIRIYDLKGSTFGRLASIPEEKKENTGLKVLKD